MEATKNPACSQRTGGPCGIATANSCLVPGKARRLRRPDVGFVPPECPVRRLLGRHDVAYPVNLDCKNLLVEKQERPQGLALSRRRYRYLPLRGHMPEKSLPPAPHLRRMPLAGKENEETDPVDIAMFVQ